MNPYKYFVNQALAIHRSQNSVAEKASKYTKLLHSVKLPENERWLNSSCAFAQRIVHWNQREVSSIKPMKNLANPWLRFKREFEQAVTQPAEQACIAISKSLGWLHYHQHEDWLNE